MNHLTELWPLNALNLSLRHFVNKPSAQTTVDLFYCIVTIINQSKPCSAYSADKRHKYFLLRIYVVRCQVFNDNVNDSRRNGYYRSISKHKLHIFCNAQTFWKYYSYITVFNLIRFISSFSFSIWKGLGGDGMINKMVNKTFIIVLDIGVNYRIFRL